VTLDLSLDLNLILSIGTGFGVPIFLVYLAYRLGRRWEIRKRIFEDKKRVYTKLEVATTQLAQALTDYRALQLLKPAKDADLKDMQLLYVRLMSIPSIWLDEGCVDVLRDYVDSGEDDEEEREEGQKEGEARTTKPEPEKVLANLKEAFEAITQRMGLELGHYTMVRSDIMGRYNAEIQRFQLTQQIKDALGKVFQLIAQMGNSMASTGLLAMMNYSAFDKGDDVGSWLRQIQDALTELSKALNADLQSSSK
jgi:hypothetical protein